MVMKIFTLIEDDNVVLVLRKCMPDRYMFETSHVGAAAQGCRRGHMSDDAMTMM